MIFAKDTVLLYLKYIQSPCEIMFSSHIAKNVQSFIFLFKIREFSFSKNQFVLLTARRDGLCCYNIAVVGKCGFAKTLTTIRILGRCSVWLIIYWSRNKLG